MPTQIPFTKVMRPCWVKLDGRAKRSRVFCKVSWDGKRLSISGVIGPRSTGNADGSCGQIAMEFQHANPAHDDSRYNKPIPPSSLDFAAGWDAGTWQDFLAIWKVYHLSDMRAGCEHQRALGWRYETHGGRLCPVCGYEIGTAWKSERVPSWVLAMLRKLPAADTTPAWV